MGGQDVGDDAATEPRDVVGTQQGAVVERSELVHARLVDDELLGSVAVLACPFHVPESPDALEVAVLRLGDGLFEHAVHALDDEAAAFEVCLLRSEHLQLIARPRRRYRNAGRLEPGHVVRMGARFEDRDDLLAVVDALLQIGAGISYCSSRDCCCSMCTSGSEHAGAPRIVSALGSACRSASLLTVSMETGPGGASSFSISPTYPPWLPPGRSPPESAVHHGRTDPPEE